MLEIVDVGDAAQEHLSARHAALQHGFGLLEKGAPVGQVRQRIPVGQAVILLRQARNPHIRPEDQEQADRRDDDRQHHGRQVDMIGLNIGHEMQPDIGQYHGVKRGRRGYRGADQEGSQNVRIQLHAIFYPHSFLI